MMNMKKEDDLKLEEYVDFYEQFMCSMASVFNYDMDIKFCRFAAEQTFQKLFEGKRSITEKDLLQLRINEPRKLEWLSKPDLYIRSSNFEKEEIELPKAMEFFHLVQDQLNCLRSEVNHGEPQQLL